MRYELIILDFDGTIADTLDEITRAFARGFAHLERPAPSHAAVRSAIGCGLEVSISRLAPDLKGPEIESVVASFGEAYAAQKDRHTKLYPGVRPFLERALEASAQLVVCSNKDQAALDGALDRLGVSDRFLLRLGSCAGRPRKPARALWDEELAPRLGSVDLTKTLMVGDDLPDLGFAAAIGCDAAWARFGFGDPTACLARSPAHQLGTFADLERVVFTGA